MREFLDRFAALGGGQPPAQKLSYLLRPTFVAPRGRTLVWGDWSSIEAVVLPWLAGDTPGAKAKVTLFRETFSDPKHPGVYRMTAGDILDKDPQDVTGSERQAFGKVPELSLGFGGGVGALQAMATNYGVYLDPETSKSVVAHWRGRNAWATRFWGAHGRDGSYGLWGAANSAIAQPDTIHEVGRVAYVYDPVYLGGTLFCALPCGRVLTYPKIKWEWREVENKKTGKLEDRYQLTFLKGYGRSALWYGKFAENITQATAASVLRRTLKRLENDDGSLRHEPMPVVMHTHDEVVTEVVDWFATQAAVTLQEIMERNDEWDAGLPLKAEVTSCWIYTKSKETIQNEH